MQKLIEVYPELAGKMKLTTDGYTLETNAMNELSEAIENRVNTEIEKEREATRVKIEETKKRLEAAEEEYRANAEGYMRSGNYEKAAELYNNITEGKKSIAQLEAMLTSYDTIPDYLKSGASGKTVKDTGGGSSSGSSSSTTTSGKGGDPENEAKYKKEYDDLKYRYDVGEIDEEKYYKDWNDLKTKYLEEDSSEWRSVNVAQHRYEESKKKQVENDTTSSKKTSGSSSSGKSGITIYSFIPTVWDTEEEKAEKIKRSKKLRSTLGDFAGGEDMAMYDGVVKSVKDSASTVGSTIASTSPASTTTTKTATLDDVVAAINKVQAADENRKISFEVIMQARDLTIGKVAVDDINDMTKMSGKTPLIIK